MLKGIITEKEFDALADQSQMEYRFCPKCRQFYLRDLSHIYPNTKLTQADIDKIVKGEEE